MAILGSLVVMCAGGFGAFMTLRSKKLTANGIHITFVVSALLFSLGFAVSAIELILIVYP